MRIANISLLFFLMFFPRGVTRAGPKDGVLEEPTPQKVEFPNGDLTLRGYIWKPSGKGPFPAMIWNHGSEKKPGTCAPLGKFYAGKGYVFFVPHRHGHGQSPGEYIMDLQNQIRMQTSDVTVIRKTVIHLHELCAQDVSASVIWLKRQRYVDRNRIVMSGFSYGGIQTILAAEQELGVRAFVPFAPAAMSWKANPLLRERLLRAVNNAKAPMFLLQAKNDYNLGPSEVLGKELKRMGKPNQAKVYPAFGTTRNEGHFGFAVHGSDIWGADILAFLEQASDRHAEQ